MHVLHFIIEDERNNVTHWVDNEVDYPESPTNSHLKMYRLNKETPQQDIV